jgi:hypothetical protein
LLPSAYPSGRARLGWIFSRTSFASSTARGGPKKIERPRRWFRDELRDAVLTIEIDHYRKGLMEREAPVANRRDASKRIDGEELRSFVLALECFEQLPLIGYTPIHGRISGRGL